MILTLFLSCCNRQKFSKPESSSVDFSSIHFTKDHHLLYAEQFEIESSDNYSLVKINGEKTILVVEDGIPLPLNIPPDVTVLKKPLDRTYLVSSSVMDFLLKLDVLNHIKFSGTKKDSWFLPKAAKAMEDGDLIYAGKYSAPDYEILYSGKANLSIQNTMIYHKPESREKLEQLGIPVLVERSSYEKNPLGKLEWIKLYGLLFDKEEEAENFFNLKINEFSGLEKYNESKKTIAFFYITSTGAVNVRKPGDYIAKSIEMAGGKYFLDSKNLEEDNALSSMNMQPEDFYIKARNADILIYNSTIDGMIADKNELLKKYPLLKDFKGFHNDKLFCTDRKFFQETTGAVDFMMDLNKIIDDVDGSFSYLVKIK